MQKSLLFIIPIFICSCIPVKIAPNIADNKVMKAKKFKRQFPNQYTFIFEDPKEANEFYDYINIKFERDHQDVDVSVPIDIDKTRFYMSFYETERETKTLNLVPLAIDAKRESNGNDAMLTDIHTSRKGQWYILIMVTDYEGNNPLRPGHEKRKPLMEYLESLRNEYLSSGNYYDVLFKKKS